MKKVVIVCGGYGYRRNPEGPVDLVTKKDGPIEVSDAEAERLVKLGVAEYAAEEKAPEEDPLKDVKIADLRARAKELGLNASGTKVELAAKIKAAEKAATESSDEDEQQETPANDETQETEEGTNDKTDNEDEPPVLAPADPEV